jgi:toxin ParE1/3/4
VAYRLVGGSEPQVNRILIDSARKFGIAAAQRYHRLMLAAFAVLGDRPANADLSDSFLPPGVRAYPLALARELVPPDERVGRPRHIVVYRIGSDGVAEVLGLAHDRMLLSRAARRMQRAAEK